MPRATGSSIDKAIQFVEEGRLSVVRIFLKEATEIVSKRARTEGTATRAPQRKAGTTAAATPAATRKPRPSRSKTAKTARAAANGGVAAGTDASTTQAAGSAGGGTGSMSMSDQQRTVDEANAGA